MTLSVGAPAKQVLLQLNLLCTGGQFPTDFWSLLASCSYVFFERNQVSRISWRHDLSVVKKIVARSAAEAEAKAATAATPPPRVQTVTIIFQLRKANKNVSMLFEQHRIQWNFCRNIKTKWSHASEQSCSNIDRRIIDSFLKSDRKFRQRWLFFRKVVS